MWLCLCKQELGVSLYTNTNTEKSLYKNSPWFGGPFCVLSIVGSACFRWSIVVLCLMLLCQLVGLVDIP